MGLLHLCFHLNASSFASDENDTLERRFQTVYKPLSKFLYSHPDFKFSISVNGELLQFLKKRKNELITIFKELTDRRQLEILGGAYYDAILPLMYPVDRNGQIDLLTSEIRQTIGRRPRGMTIFADAWDSSLVNNINTCGIEYVILNNPIISGYKDAYLPLIMSELGKSVDIFPYYEEFVPDAGTEPGDFVSLISKSAERAQKKSSFVQMQPDRVILISLNYNQILPLIENGWFDRLLAYLSSVQTNIRLNTPGLYRKDGVVKIPSFIPCGISEQVLQESDLYGIKFQAKNKGTYSFLNYLENYSAGAALYHKILYVSNLINQYKGDKIRKKTARDKLWSSQKGSALVWNPCDVVQNVANRQKSYKTLIEIEKSLNESEDFKENITNLDYDCDGLKEYVCRMKNFSACISLISGAMTELEVLKGGGNYADLLSRKEPWDEESDTYRRGIFVDHVFSEEQFENYIQGKTDGNGIFSRIQYSEIKYSQTHKEIHLMASAVAFETRQKIFLRKKYIITSDGLYVQYILKNCSDKTLKMKFAVESTLANVNYSAASQAKFALDLIDCGEKIGAEDLPDSGELRNDAYRQGRLQNVSTVRISDLQNGISFVFEPNEKCCYYFCDLDFRRPDNNGIVKTVQTAFVSTLFWDIELEPGMETEKNINFAMTSVKKLRKSS